MPDQRVAPEQPTTKAYAGQCGPGITRDLGKGHLRRPGSGGHRCRPRCPARRVLEPSHSEVQRNGRRAEQVVAERAFVVQADDHQRPPGSEPPAEEIDRVGERQMVDGRDAGDDVVVGTGRDVGECIPTKKLTRALGQVRSRATAMICGSASKPSTTSARVASSLARSPLPQPTSRAAPNCLGSRRMIHGW